MPQLCIPIFAEGITYINVNLGYKKEAERVYYFNGQVLPVFSHEATDIRSFRMIVSQFFVNGHATQAEIVKAFGIPAINLKRAVKIFRTLGPAGFYQSSRPTRKPRILTPEVLAKVQSFLDDGMELKDISCKMSIKLDTLQKAIREKHLKKKTPSLPLQ